jgi:hypothetical protein
METTGTHQSNTFVASGGSAASVLVFQPDVPALRRIADRHRPIFERGEPFRHVAIDRLFPEAVLDGILLEAESHRDGEWTVWGPGLGKNDPVGGAKVGLSRQSLLGPITWNLLQQLNSAAFVEFIQRVSGIDKLIPDPGFAGGGLHRTGRGGRLLVHTDPDRHSAGQPFQQMVNLILYLNKDWPETFAGDLELWSRDADHCVTRINPLFGRLVLFESGTNTFHGHPGPLQCPSNRFRYSIAVYYYVIGRRTSPEYLGFQKHVHWHEG